MTAESNSLINASRCPKETGTDWGAIGAFIKELDSGLIETNHQRYKITIPGTIGAEEETGSLVQTVPSMNMAEPCTE